MTTEQFLCEKTKLIWDYYLLNSSMENFQKMFADCSEQLVTIGTGKNEYFTSLDQLVENLTGTLNEVPHLHFELLDEWYECLKVAEEVYLVYGGFWAREKNTGCSESLADMDTRFSILYRKKGEKWEILHLHHSMPYAEQQEGEYYPKTLSQKAREALELAKLYQKKSEMDLMTGIYNNETFKYYASKKLEECSHAYLYIFDLDYFKKINDTYGHMTGDGVLKLFARILQRIFPDGVVIGRIGGDEFSVFQCAQNSRQDCERQLSQMARQYQKEVSEIISYEQCGSYSVGIAEYKASCLSLQDLMVRADQALYRAKRTRGAACWHDEER